MKKILVILGPTATGKTDLALQLAHKFSGELISADSRQVYKGLDIGTGKEPGIKNKELKVKRENGYWEMDGIKVWMYDVADPKIRYTVFDYANRVDGLIEDILLREKLPIVVGGTGLYIRALTEDLANLGVPTNDKLRGELEKLSLTEMQQKLQLLSPACFASLNNSDRNNPRRLLRSIELIIMNPNIVTRDKVRVINYDYDVLKIGLTAPREVLQNRIYTRLISRLNQGMVKEAEQLYRGGLSLERMKELGLEYGMLARLLAGEISENQFIDQLSVKIGQYAKRQMTWFKKDTKVKWFNITEENLQHKVEKTVHFWYDQGNDETY